MTFCYAASITMNLSKGIWALRPIFKLEETIISFHCCMIMLGTWDGVSFLLEGKLRAIPGLAHHYCYSMIMICFPEVGTVQACHEDSSCPRYMLPWVLMDIYMPVTPGTANRTFELNEIFYMCQAKHALKSIQDLDLCNHGPRLQNLTIV